jgi:micrococcal nuclease
LSIYTYKAFIIDVIDGDTLHVEVDRGFHIRVNQVLRLRGIDAYEISTVLGKKGRDFILERFKALTFIVIKTYRKDKYSRYLVDVFYKPDDNDIFSVVKNGNFLNQELLDNKLAVKYYIY